MIDNTIARLTFLIGALASSLASTAVQAAGDEICLEGGRYSMGSNNHYREEGPARDVDVAPFCLDRTEVSNSDFAEFVEATGYVTLAERGPERKQYPNAPEAFFSPGSAVFVKPDSLVGLTLGGWWQFIVEANWRQPEGRPVDMNQIAQHPVVHIAYEDAEAYAQWRGRRLASEAEWEFAARDGLNGQPYAGGSEAPSTDAANTWQGRFPIENTADDGFQMSSPVGHYPASKFGFHDLIGNVWEWTSTPFSSRPGAAPNRTIKGGSFLCADNFCLRYRPAARQAQETGLGSNHIGFRTARSAEKN